MDFLEKELNDPFLFVIHPPASRKGLGFFLKNRMETEKNNVQPIPLEIRKNGFDYTLCRRGRRSLIYGQETSKKQLFNKLERWQ